MRRSIWMAPWDLAGREPGEVISFLRGLGLDACSLALAYHGGRLLLPNNPRHVVYEQRPSAAYYPSRIAETALETPLVMRFLEVCRDLRFPVEAWTVLCHNDRPDPPAPPIENIFGERYSYALCPANPETRRYAVALCAEIAALPGVDAIDLEAAGYMGYEHAGLHDKRGLSLPAEVVFLLSICMCPHCRERIGTEAESIRREAIAAVRLWLREGILQTPPPSPALLAARREAQRDLLAEIRRATAGVPVNLRLALDPLFTGGKSTLCWSDLPGLVNTATVTFFGASVDRMTADLRRLPPPTERPVPVRGGFVFHGPDCSTEADLAARLDLLFEVGLDGIAFYSFSMAAPRHFDWLRHALSHAEMDRKKTSPQRGF